MITPAVPRYVLEGIASAVFDVFERRRAANLKTIPLAFDQWLPAVSPELNWQWPYIRYVRAHLDRITDGDIRKLMIMLPPRHGKSQLATIRYPAYRLECNPRLKIIVGAYNQTLANKFSRRARRIAESRLRLSDERTAVEDWETQAGGGYRAVGVGGGIVGQGGDLIIMDDPVKNREEAESQTYRDNVWDWYSNDLYTRQEPGCSFILIMTRWHKDDLAGRILASDDGPNWTVITLPAEAEPGDPLGRAIGEPLCPDRYDREALADFRRTLARDYQALYQQSPQARDGGMFKEHWLSLVDAVPAEARRVRWWDRASTAGGGDYTAGVLVAYAQGLWFIEDVMRGQWSGGERDRIIYTTAESDQARYVRVDYWTEQEPGSSGKDKAADFVRMLAGYSANAEPATGSKEVRADALSKQAEWGNVKVKRAAWASAFIAEMLDFPNGQHDDQVDAAASAFNKLIKAPVPISAGGAESGKRNPHARRPKSSWAGR